MTDDEGGSPYEYSPTRDLHYTHARPSQHHDYSNPQFPPPPAMDPYHPDAHMHSHQYTAYYMPPPPPPPVPPIPPHDPFEEPRSQDYYGGHGGTGRYYQPREREIPRVEKEREKERRWSPPAVAAAEAAHAGALRRNDSSGSSSRGHGKEKERKKIVERGESERKGSRLVEKSSALGTREKGNPLRELEQLRFTPKVTAGTHMRRFEKLVGMAYPGVSSGGKWSMFVKTLDHPGLWGGSGKTTPGRWAMELRKTENMSFDHMKALFIERWGTKEEREQLQSNLDKKKEKDRERQERDHQYLHQQLISTADSLPKTSSKLSHLVIHHDDERPIQLETNAPEGGEIVVTITDDKRRRGKERPTRERLVEGNSKKERQQVQERERERARGSTKSSSRTASTAPKPASKSSSSASPPMSAPPSSPPPQNRDSWGTADPSWGAEDQSWGADEQGKGNFASDAPQQDEWNSGGTVQNEWNQENNSDGGNKDDWNASASPPKSPPREQTPQPKYLAVDEWGANAPSSNPRNTPQPSQESSSTIMAPSSNQGVSLAATAPGSPPAPPLEPTTSVRQRLLEGKIAAITGASRGIGRAIALGFAREGAHIVAHYWGTVSDPSNDDIVSLATEIRGMGQRCEVVFGDISDPDTSHNIVQKAVEEFGRLDIGVGNAGMCWFRDFWDITPELMRRHVDVNLNGNMWFVQACARQMKAQYVTATKTALDEDSWAGDGDLGDIPDHSLLLVSSTTSMTASPAAAHYAASSAGIVSLVQSMAVELGKYGIRCNALLPGTVMTRMVKEGVEDVDRRRGMERRVPLLGRLGRPRDVVGPAIFLAGEQSRYVTGAKLAVDGGASAGGGGGW